MQKLQFEPAWDKTIAPQDRKKITDIFNKLASSLGDGVQMTFLWDAVNHKNELLITALIHNYHDERLQLNNTAIAYKENNQTIATDVFTIDMMIAGKTSMPWTFIFSLQNEANPVPKYVIEQQTTPN